MPGDRELQSLRRGLLHSRIAVFEHSHQELVELGGQLILSVEAGCVADGECDGGADGREGVIASFAQAGDTRVCVPGLASLLPPSQEEIKQVLFMTVVPPGGECAGGEAL